LPIDLAAIPFMLEVEMHLFPFKEIPIEGRETWEAPAPGFVYFIKDKVFYPPEDQGGYEGSGAAYDLSLQFDKAFVRSERVNRKERYFSKSQGASGKKPPNTTTNGFKV
jgi:hypothetical protein